MKICLKCIKNGTIEVKNNKLVRLSDIKYKDKHIKPKFDENDKQ